MHPDELLADLDPDQRAAVAAEGSLVAVIAGAGSGKTRVLTRRIAYRIGVGTADARHTLALTFTRQAAGELRRRLRAVGLREHVEAGTFHSVMLALLRQRWADTDRRPRTVVTDRRRLLREVLSAGDRRPTAASFEALLAELDWAASRGFDGVAYRRALREVARRPSPGVDTSARVIDGYAELKASRGIIDFDDVLALAVRELEGDPQFMDATRWRFRHLLVDEAQDLNPLQQRVIDLLRAGRDDLFLVGDPAQAIYGFNGADPTLLVDIEHRFAGVEVIRLPVNHRSTPQIVAAGTHVLERSRQPAALSSGRSDGDAVQLHRSDDAVAEAEHIARLAGRVDPNLLRNGELAVLARTNAQLEPIGQSLERAGMTVRRSTTNASSPVQTALREAAANPSAARLRAWAHDTLDDLGPTDPGPEPRADPVDAERTRVAAAALEFLREHPLGDGATFRAWVATSQVFEPDDRAGVELLTFHAAKGREWHTVIVSGVESSLVPHKSATTAATRAEEARLLYVALTRATDRLHVTSAARRGGYARTPSPLLADFEPPAPAAPPPPRQRDRHRHRPDELLTALREWRNQAARRADMLPDQLCSARDLSAIAAGRPVDADELEALTSFGPITARRLAPQILQIVATAER